MADIKVFYYPELVRLVGKRIANEDEKPITIQRMRTSLCLVVDIEDFLDEGVVRVEYVFRNGRAFREGWFILEDSFIIKAGVLFENYLFSFGDIYDIMSMFFDTSCRPEHELPCNSPEYETADS